MRKTITTLLILISISYSITSCNGADADSENKQQAHLVSDSTMQLLRIDTVKMKLVDDEVKLSGQVSFDDNKVVKVYPFSSGQVIKVNVSLGDFVKAGQPLATIRSAEIAGNYGDLSVAGNDVAIAKRAMNNAEHLFKNGIASEREYEEAKENYNKAVANESKIREQIAINGGGRTAANGTYVVVAPRSGYVVEKFINPGDFIRSDNNSDLFTIGDVSDVWIWANVFETDVAKIKEGYAADVTTIAYPDTVFAGKVDRINEVLDPVTKVMKVRIVLSNKNGMLKPEMFANITIRNNESKKAICVPSTAIISENGKNYVVVFNNQDDIKVKEVSILKTTGPVTFLNTGVSEGEKLITSNQILVYGKLKEK